MIGTLYNFYTNRRYISQNGTTFVAEFWLFTEMVSVLFVNFLYFSPIVPFLLQNFAVFPNGTFSVGIFCVQIGAEFSQIVPFLLVNFYNFLK